MSIYEKLGEIRQVIKSSLKVDEHFKRDAIYILSTIVTDTFKNDDKIPKTLAFVARCEFFGDLEKLKEFLEKIVEVKVNSISIEKITEHSYFYIVTLI